MKLIAVVVAVVVLSACANNPPSAEAKAEAAQSVGVLFTVDGVTVYRFGDNGRYHYFAVRDGRPDTVTVNTWTETHSCGKNCTRTEFHQDAITLLSR